MFLRADCIKPSPLQTIPHDNRHDAHNIAAYKGHADAIKLLLAANANPNIVDYLGFTPVFIAAQNGYVEVINLLLAANAIPTNITGARDIPNHTSEVTVRQLTQILSEHIALLAALPGAPQYSVTDIIASICATMNDHAIKGFKGKTGFMPAKGGRSDLSDAAVKAAVKYMADQSK